MKSINDYAEMTREFRKAVRLPGVKVTKASSVSVLEAAIDADVWALIRGEA